MASTDHRAPSTQHPAPLDQTFQVPAAGEAVAVIHASCERCDWGAEGREAAVVRILVDGKYSSTWCWRAGPTMPTIT